MDDAEPRSTRRYSPPQAGRSQGWRVRATGTGMCRERGPEDARSEGTRSKLDGSPFSFEQAWNPGGMVLVTFAETKVTRRTGAEPRIKFLCKYAQ